MSRIGSVLGINDSTGELTTACVGTSAFRSSAVDGVGITLTGGALALQAAGASLSSGVQRDEVSKFAGAVIKGDLADSDVLGGLMTEENTYGTDLICELDVQITTASTAACTASFGVTTNPAVAAVDNLIDDADVNAPASKFVYTSIDSTLAGTNGRARVVWPDGYYISGSKSTGAAADLVGTYVIRVIDAN